VLDFMKTCRAPCRSAILLALVAIVSCSAARGQTHEQPAPEPLLVKVGEAKVDNVSGVVTNDCMLVLPDGRFRIERGRQVVPADGSVKVFESSIDSSQLEALWSIVRSQDTDETPTEVAPTAALNVPWFTRVYVTLEIGGRARRSGYWKWRGETPELDRTPDEVKKRWQDSEKKLQPLVEWFHGIEALKLIPSDTEPNQCDGWRTP
jgi:hypothetical protein